MIYRGRKKEKEKEGKREREREHYHHIVSGKEEIPFFADLCNKHSIASGNRMLLDMQGHVHC